MNRDISIPASGISVAVPLGPFKYLLIRSADVAFKLSFDGSYWQTARQNDRYDQSQASPLPEKIYVMAVNGLAAAVSVIYDTKPIGAQDTAQSIILNSARGCGGAKNALAVPEARTVANAAYAYDGVAAVDLTKNGILYIPGVVNGRRRKEITFDNRSGGADVVVFAPDGSLVHRFVNGDAPRTIETSSDFYVGGNGGAATKFIYNELFYDQSNS